MVMPNLIIQVLGNSDILVDRKDGFKRLQKADSLESIRDNAKSMEEDLIHNLDKVEFDLIKKLNQKQSQDTIFVFILTNQIKWIQEKNNTFQGWNEYATSDGIWWENVLAAWCEKQNLRHYPIILNVTPDINYGVADWEGMAQLIDLLLDKCFKFEESDSIYFQPSESERIKIDKITVQHSSGTPALSGALYLWGIEKKLTAKDKIEFVYISKQEVDCSAHLGDHWQWRLKDPQIRELLKIQDFSGALKLLDEQHPHYEQIKNNLEFLDKSVSLNLDGRLQGKDSVIERLSIAVWSEKAFRDRSQWMHWYLRVAGALELALLLLVETQGNGNYQWEKHKLILNNDKKNGEVALCGISFIVKELLRKGCFSDNDYSHFTINKVVDDKWSEFKKFYIDNCKIKRNDQPVGFITLRNSLYHSLIGDDIDQFLDKKTEELNNDVSHEDHPSQIAVNWLKYIIKLAGLSTSVDAKAEFYMNKVSETITLI